jgi:endoglycosylceramidase
MKRLLALAALALFAATAPGAAAAGPAAPLDHAGRWTTDARGHVVVLHGLNMVSKLPPYAPDSTGFGDDDAAFLAAEGFNTVRVGVIYKAVEPQPGVYDDAYLQRIQSTVDTLGRHGIFALIDFHQDLYNERFQGEGWPDWAVQDDGLPAQPQAGFPGNYLGMPALQHAFDHFWANDAGPGGVGLQDRYAAAWRHVAGRFRDNANVLGYDLLNEPWPGTTWQQCANPAGCPAFDATMSGFVARTLAAIRQADPDTLVFYEPQVLFNNGADTHLADTGDAHAAMSFHDYCLTASEGNGGYGACGQSDDMVFANADKRAETTGDALLLTEFGATDTRDVLLGVLERADRAMVGWQEWHYCGCADPTTSGPGDKQAIVRDPNKPPAGDNLIKGTLDTIVRPYPQVVSGTPESWAFDPDNRVFDFAYSTKRADGGGSFPAGSDTEVAVPSRQYGSGYAVAVQGGTVTSAGSEVLKVAACTGVDRVTVSVKPGSGATASCAAASKGAAKTQLRVTLAPRKVRAGRRVTVRATVRAKGKAVRGAVVRIGRKRARTDDRGGACGAEVRSRGRHPPSRCRLVPCSSSPSPTSPIWLKSTPRCRGTWPT